MRINQALIMAAGRGLRMMPFTNDKPKAMAPHDGSTLIAKGIDDISRIIPKIHITVGYKGALLAQHVIEHNVCSVINTEGKGNAWWIYNSLLKNVDEPIFVLTCDNVINLDFVQLEKDYFESKEPACMVVPVKPVDGLSGDYIFCNGQKIVKLSRREKSEIYCSGIQILNPKKINSITKPSDNFYQTWNQLIEKHELYCSRVYPNHWFAVDTLSQLEQLNKV